MPEEFQTKLENTDVIVDNYPTQNQPAEAGLKRGQTLLGIYKSVPLTKRDKHYGLVPPEKITIFQKPIKAKYRGDDKIADEVRRMVRHEITHHFGIGDARLEQIEGDED